MKKKRKDGPQTPKRGTLPWARGLFLFLLLSLFFCRALPAEEQAIPLGPDYEGPKCVIAVEGFAVAIPGAPKAVAEGLSEMLQTALFESNYFIVVDRSDVQGISAEKLLSDSFMADPEAVLSQDRMEPAELLIYGTLTELEGGGAGLRVKAPWMPLKVGGKYHKARAVIDLRVVDAASGRVLATAQKEGTATSGGGLVKSSFRGIDLPVGLEAFRNTPLELSIRDCIYRGVVHICQAIPSEFFRH